MARGKNKGAGLIILLGIIAVIVKVTAAIAVSLFVGTSSYLALTIPPFQSYAASFAIYLVIISLLFLLHIILFKYSAASKISVLSYLLIDISFSVNYAKEEFNKPHEYFFGMVNNIFTENFVTHTNFENILSYSLYGWICFSIVFLYPAMRKYNILRADGPAQTTTGKSKNKFSVILIACIILFSLAKFLHKNWYDVQYFLPFLHGGQTSQFEPHPIPIAMRGNSTTLQNLSPGASVNQQTTPQATAPAQKTPTQPAPIAQTPITQPAPSQPISAPPSPSGQSNPSVAQQITDNAILKTLMDSAATLSRDDANKLASSMVITKQPARNAQLADAFNKIGRENLWKQKDNAAALDNFKNAYENDTSNPEYSQNYGYALYLTGNFDGAIQKLVESLEHGPKRASVWFSLGEVCAARGMTDAAYQCLINACKFTRNINTTRKFLQDKSANSYFPAMREASQKALVYSQNMQ